MKEKAKKSNINKWIGFLVVFFSIFVFGWTYINQANPINLYLFTYPVQNIRAFFEVQDFKPHLILKKGDCRIQNTISAIKNPDLYIVLGKAYNKKANTNPENHQWTVLDPDHPSNYDFIVDNTTGTTEEVKRQSEYIPYNVYKLDVDKCKVKLIRQVKKNITHNEEYLLRLGEFYIEAFCRYYKWKYQNKRGA